MTIAGNLLTKFKFDFIATPSSQPKKKKPLAERIKEKQEKRRQEQLARQEVSEHLY